jgi:hypothetical protein
VQCKKVNGWKERKVTKTKNAESKEKLVEREGEIIFENTSVVEPYNTKAYPDEFFADRKYDF